MRFHTILNAMGCSHSRIAQHPDKPRTIDKVDAASTERNLSLPSEDARPSRPSRSSSFSDDDFGSDSRRQSMDALFEAASLVHVTSRRRGAISPSGSSVGVTPVAQIAARQPSDPWRVGVVW